MQQQALAATGAALRRRRIPLAVAAGLLLVYALAGFLLAPMLLRHAAENYVAQTLGRQLQIGALRFNPFRGELQIDALQLKEADGSPLLGFAHLELNADPLASLFTRSISLSKLRLVQPDVTVIIDKDGSLNLARLTPPSEPSAQTAPQPPPAIRIGHLAIEDGRVALEDRSKAAPFKLELTPIRFALDNFRTQADYHNHYQFNAVTAAQEQLDWNGDFTVQPLGSSGELRISQLQLRTVADYLQQQLPVRLAGGQVDLQGHYQLQLNPLELALQLPAIRMQKLVLAEQNGKTQPLHVPQIDIESLSLSLAQRRLKIAAVKLDGTQLDVRREPDGSLNLARLLASPAPATDKTAAAGSSDAPSLPWHLALDHLQLQNSRIRLEDRGVAGGVKLQLAPLSLRVDGYNSEPDAAPTLQLQTGIVQADTAAGAAGQLQADGKLQLQPLSADLSLDLRQFSLPLLQPYLAQATSMQLHSGQLAMQARLGYRQQQAGPQLSFAGDVQLGKLRASDRVRQQDFLRWQQLQISGIDFQQHGADQATQRALSIGRVQLREPYARVIINPDQTLNIAQILQPAQTSAAPRQPTAATSKSEASSQASAAPMAIRIKSLRIDGGSANFADQSIEPSFAAGIVGLRGDIDGLSSDPASRARIHLQGNVDRYAPVLISGSANLLSAAQYCDLSLSFRNMELSTFNPYSGKFAGYNIVKGKLTTELHYKIEQRQLAAEHHVILDQLEFGDATGSKDAAPLPVKLAAALLKDRHGVIDLELPVRGSLDDPDFRYGKLLWKVAFNLLSKIATAPFAALGSLFGGGEELQYVDFAAGSASLDAAQNDKLAKLAQALQERPQLKLEVPITGGEADRDALARQALLARVPAGGDDKTRLRALEKLGRELKVAKPESAKDSDDAARIAQLEAPLRARLAPDASALDQLARERAQAVQQQLLGGTGIAPERIFITSGGGAATGESGAVRMSLKLQ